MTCPAKRAEKQEKMKIPGVEGFGSEDRGVRCAFWGAQAWVYSSSISGPNSSEKGVASALGHKEAEKTSKEEIPREAWKCPPRGLPGASPPRTPSSSVFWPVGATLAVFFAKHRRARKSENTKRRRTSDRRISGLRGAPWGAQLWLCSSS